jgi:hypothetical protein
MSITLSELLKKMSPDTEERVDKTRQVYNPIIREALRKEMAFVLNRQALEGSTESVTVPIKLTEGRPDNMEDMEFDEKEQLLWVLSGYQGSLESMRGSAEDIADLLSSLVDHRLGNTIVNGRDEHLPPVRTLLDDLLNFIKERDVLNRVLSLSTDVFGSYFPTGDGKKGALNRSPHIKLYWGIIGLCASGLGATMETLTLLVLAHELAHAYTHLGMDTDEQRWSTKSFTRAEDSLVEGLAQYYTHLVCRRLDARVPKLYATYETLLKYQTLPYHTHEKWIRGYTEENIRSALLHVRLNDLRTVDDFMEALESTYQIGHHSLEVAKGTGKTR